MGLNISLIRASFEEAKPIAQDIVNYFYQTLLETYPSVRPLFAKTDIEKQKQALIGALVTIVNDLDDPSALVPYLKKMGGRHVKYGAREEHYSMVGKSLIKTFRHFFGTKWTPELEEQWILAIGTIADSMLEGAKEVQEAQAVSHQMVSIAPLTPKSEPQELSHSVRSIARSLLFRALEEEMDGEFLKAAKKRAAAILTQAIREEAEKIQEHFQSKKKAS